jgi:CubicO group peptidase (beta-lactamase class C family)
MDFHSVWAVPDAQVAAGRMPGYVAAVHAGGRTEVRCGGRTAVEPDSAPMREDTLFRIASLTKHVAAVLALTLVADGTIGLADEVAPWLPELAEPRVLVTPDAPLTDTVPATRPITVRHLLTMTIGWGAILDPTPLQGALLAGRLFPGPLPRPMTGDEYLARLAALPMAFQPGDGWLYDTGTDVLGVLLARATGRPTADLVAERVTGPLGMTDTTFGTSEVDRLATAYRPTDDGLAVLDPPDGGFARPPAFTALSSGLVSTVGDLLRFYRAMADGGAPVLSPDLLALMTADALTDEQRRQAEPIVGAGASWGLATSVDVEAARPGQMPGRWGWNGGTGTTAYVDPGRGTVGVLLTQRALMDPLDGFDAFWAAVAGG